MQAVLGLVFDMPSSCTTRTDTQLNGAKNTINFFLVNATSLAKADAVQQLGLDLVNTNTHVALVTETWFCDKFNDECLSVANYTLVRRDRVKRKGGGVCMYIRNDVMFEQLPINNAAVTVEILWVKCMYVNSSYFIACCYHPPKPIYSIDDVRSSLIYGIDYVGTLACSDRGDDFIIVAGDFNTLDCHFLETQFGLVQIVKAPTHCTSVLDKVYTSRPDIFTATVVKSLIKTKHKAVIVKGESTKSEPIAEDRKIVKLYDLRAHNVDRLRYITATFDWSHCLMCHDMQKLYDMFVQSVHSIIEHSIPVRLVRLGHLDPAFVTPLVKVLLRKRYRLRRQGRIEDADILAVRINTLIHDARSKQLAHLSSRSTKVTVGIC